MKNIFNICIPFKLKGLANSFGGHWSMRANEAKRAKNKVGIRISNAIKGGKIVILPNESISIKLNRVYCGRSRAMDSDNLANAFKHVRDAISRAIGIDDGSNRISFRYCQWKVSGKGLDGLGDEILIEIYTS